MNGPSGRLAAIWVKRSHRGLMDPARSATLEVGVGIVGNADRGGRRQVTLLEHERWLAAAAELGATLEPEGRRANLLLSGVSLVESRNRLLEIGACRIRIRGETKPCERMDELHHGLKDALWPNWGGGAYGEILIGGVIEVGDAARWISESV